MREYFQDRKTAFLVPPSDSAILRDTIYDTLADDDLREGVARQGQIAVREKFTLNRMWSDVSEKISALETVI